MGEAGKTIVSVCYMDKKTGEFGGRAYSYYCDIPAKPGDTVIAPTARGGAVAKVREVDVPMSKIDERVEPPMKTITEFAKIEETEGKGDDDHAADADAAQL